MTIAYNTSIVKDNSLIFYVDAANKKSYPGSGSTLYDLSGNGNNATLNNSPSFSSLYRGCFVLNNSNNSITLSSNINYDTLVSTKNFTIMFGAQKQYYGVNGNNTGDSMLLLGSTSGYLQGWRIRESNLGTPGNAFTGIASYDFGASNTINITDTIANRVSVVAFSQSGTVMTGFLNSNIKTSSFTTAYTTGTSSGVIGAANYGVGSFGGLFSFMMIYNRSLSVTEITKNFEALRGRYGV